MDVINESQIGEAALCLFLREGHAAAITIANVAAELHCGTDPIYAFYPNRDALVAALQTRLFDDLLGLIQEGFGRADDDARSRLYRLIDIYVRHARENPERYQLMFLTPLPPPGAHPELTERRRALVDLGVGAWQAAADAGLDISDAPGTMHMAWAAVHGLICLEANGQLDLDHGFDDLLRITLHRLLGPRVQARLAVV